MFPPGLGVPKSGGGRLQGVPAGGEPWGGFGGFNGDFGDIFGDFGGVWVIWGGLGGLKGVLGDLKGFFRGFGGILWRF